MLDDIRGGALRAAAKKHAATQRPTAKGEVPRSVPIIQSTVFGYTVDGSDVIVGSRRQVFDNYHRSLWITPGYVAGASVRGSAYAWANGRNRMLGEKRFEARCSRITGRALTLVEIVDVMEGGAR